MLDVMTLKTKWARQIVSETLEKKLSEKLGTKLGISMDEITIKNTSEGDVSVYIAGNFSIDRGDLMKLLGNPFA